MAADGARRFRAGSRPVTSVGWSVFLLVMAAAFVAVGVSEDRVVFHLLAAGTASIALWWLLDSVNGLRPIVLTPDPVRTLSVPTFSIRHGYRRTVWSLDDVVGVDLHRIRGMQFPYRCVQITTRRDRVDSDALTCSVRRRHPERSRAGRAVAELQQLAGTASPW